MSDKLANVSKTSSQSATLIPKVSGVSLHKSSCTSPLCSSLELYDDTDAYFICLILDPNVKDAYAKSKWAPRFFRDGMKAFEKVFDKYLSENPKPTTPSDDSPLATSSGRVGSYGHSWMRDAVKSRITSDAVGRSSRQELQDYLTSPLKDVVACTTLSSFQSCLRLRETISRFKGRRLYHLSVPFRAVVLQRRLAATACQRRHLLPFSS